MRNALILSLALLGACTPSLALLGACTPSPAVRERAAERAEMQRHAAENMRWCLEGIAANCDAAGRAMVAAR